MLSRSFDSYWNQEDTFDSLRDYIALKFADIVYLPRKKHQDKPAMIVELKWDKSAEGAIEQVKTKKYVKVLEDYKGNLLLIGVNYSKDSKEHQCIIEEILV